MGQEGKGGEGDGLKGAQPFFMNFLFLDFPNFKKLEKREKERRQNKRRKRKGRTGFCQNNSKSFILI